ncbi:hypothetical protein Y5S_02587 [Alcanivorax nanhaiticus]|uniref:Uncharacterized protein n=1 Tax=Alcanivorax nanhaiticus TaxID=1177154 RepID=A0A095SHM9_9GAMM|nr:hypothetical protein [Alcanivorax nanhaiticus]KGD64047.1 hypothetical protein Y5S_02587 [Alcanivorax nanhaiticus]
MKSKLIKEDEIRLEADKHSEFLNTALGLLTFTLALTCLSFDHPQRAAIICLGVVIPVYIQAWKHFPKSITALRELVKDTDDEHAKQLLRYLEGKYLGFRSMLTKNVLLWYGLIFYFLVLLDFPPLEWLKI